MLTLPYDVINLIALYTLVPPVPPNTSYILAMMHYPHWAINIIFNSAWADDHAHMGTVLIGSLSQPLVV